MALPSIGVTLRAVLRERFSAAFLNSTQLTHACVTHHYFAPARPRRDEQILRACPNDVAGVRTQALPLGQRELRRLNRARLRCLQHNLDPTILREQQLQQLAARRRPEVIPLSDRFERKVFSTQSADGFAQPLTRGRIQIGLKQLHQTRTVRRRVLREMAEDANDGRNRLGTQRLEFARHQPADGFIRRIAALQPFQGSANLWILIHRQRRHHFGMFEHLRMKKRNSPQLGEHERVGRRREQTDKNRAEIRHPSVGDHGSQQRRKHCGITC